MIQIYYTSEFEIFILSIFIFLFILLRLWQHKQTCSSTQCPLSAQLTIICCLFWTFFFNGKKVHYCSEYGLCFRFNMVLKMSGPHTNRNCRQTSDAQRQINITPTSTSSVLPKDPSKCSASIFFSQLWNTKRCRLHKQTLRLCVCLRTVKRNVHCVCFYCCFSLLCMHEHCN